MKANAQACKERMKSNRLACKVRLKCNRVAGADRMKSNQPNQLAFEDGINSIPRRMLPGSPIQERQRHSEGPIQGSRPLQELYLKVNALLTMLVTTIKLTMVRMANSTKVLVGFETEESNDGSTDNI